MITYTLLNLKFDSANEIILIGSLKKNGVKNWTNQGTVLRTLTYRNSCILLNISTSSVQYNFYSQLCSTDSLVLNFENPEILIIWFYWK